MHATFPRLQLTQCMHMSLLEPLQTCTGPGSNAPVLGILPTKAAKHHPAPDTCPGFKRGSASDLNSVLQQGPRKAGRLHLLSFKQSTGC
jgi:hypothetical protein